MIKNKSFQLIFSVASLLIGVGFLSAFLIKNKPDSGNLNPEKINLALRQTAHLLLKQAGDSTSRIAPIEVTDANKFLVRLERHFNYDSLPVFLNKSFENHQIVGDYDVAVWDCSFKNLILGYNALSFAKDGSVPCGGRDRGVECYNFTVTFTNSQPKYADSVLKGIFAGLLISFGVVGLLYFFKQFKKEKPIISEDLTEGVGEGHLIRVGNSIFDTNNQIFKYNNIETKLTYREAKLLQLFCAHKNELLDRDYILKQVWEDEGVLVGRSVDVFVSRLRKIMKNDDSLKISNVHARGYRFEILSES